MNTTKPPKIFVINGRRVRIVSKEEYRLHKIKDPILSILCPTMFMVCLECIVLDMMSIGYILYFHNLQAPALYLILALTVGAVVSGILNSNANNAMETGYFVEPISDQNAHLLSAEDTLLRGSNLLPTQHKLELPRAAQTEQDVPTEELLRALGAE